MCLYYYAVARWTSHLDSEFRTAHDLAHGTCHEILPVISLSSLSRTALPVRQYTHAHELLNTQDNQRCVPCCPPRVSSGPIYPKSRLPLAVHSFCAALLHVSPTTKHAIPPLPSHPIPPSPVSETPRLPQPATERGHASRVLGAVDAAAPRLRAALRLVHIADRGRGGDRWWRVGRGSAESEDQSWVLSLLLVFVFVFCFRRPGYSDWHDDCLQGD